MKRLILLIAFLICVYPQTPWAQIRDYELVRRDTLIFGKGITTVDSLVMTLPPFRGMSLFKFWVRIDSLAGAATFDSTLLYFRESYGDSAHEIPVATDGDYMDWALVKVYEGGDTFTNWGLSFPLQNGDRIDCKANMGGHIWDAITFKITKTDSAAVPADSGRAIIEMWRQK